jgi:protein-disulfide isomerase
MLGKPMSTPPEAPHRAAPSNRSLDLVTWVIFLLCLATATVAATALLVDYTSIVPKFCGVEGACEALRRTRFSHIGPIQTPVLGLVGLAVMAVLAWFRGARARLAQVIFAAMLGAVGALLVAVQFRFKHYCPFCLVVDNACILLFCVMAVRYVRGLDPPQARPLRAAAAVMVALAGTVTGVVGVLRPVQTAPVPPVIAEELARTPPGKTTVIDFVDFECPHCRYTHGEIEPLLSEHKDELRVVRKHVPLSMHPHALSLAKAACCGESLGQGDAMADALMATTDFSPEHCDKIAESLHLDVEAFRRCLVSPATEERIKKDTADFRAAQGRGLPTIWIGPIKLEGRQDRADLVTVFDRVLKKS